MVSRLRELMEGRYGVDRLSVAVLTSSAVLNSAGLITRHMLYSQLSALLFLIALFRTMSKNLDRRQAENYRFLGLWGKGQYAVERLRSRLAQSREYKFLYCPGCKSRLRVKRYKGKIQVTCPRCGLRFSKRL